MSVAGGPSARSRHVARVAGLAAALAGLLIGLPQPARAAELPPETLAVLMLRVLAYDRSVARLPGAEITIAVISRAGDAASEAGADALAEAIRKLSGKVNVDSKAIRVLRVPFGNRADFERRLDAVRPAAMFLEPALETAAGDLQALSRRLSVLTFTSVANLAKVGASVGLVSNGDKAKIMINLAAAKAEGADLDASLLRLAEIVR